VLSIASVATIVALTAKIPTKPRPIATAPIPEVIIVPIPKAKRPNPSIDNPVPIIQLIGIEFE